MQFQKMKKDPNTIMRKKMYKKGKNWIVASTLALGATAIFSTTVVDAAATQLKENVSHPSQLEDGTIQTTVDVKTNMDKLTLKVVGKPNSTVQVVVPSVGSFHADKIVITVKIDAEGHATTDDTLVLSKLESSNQNQINFELPDGLGTDEIIKYGRDGTSDYVISKDGVLYLMEGTLSVKDTQEIGKKYGQLINRVKLIGNTYSVKTPEDSSYLFANYFMNVKSMDNMYSMDVSDTVNASYMFAGLTSLERLRLGSFNDNKNSNMHAMFKDDRSLDYLDITGLDTENVSDMSEIFSGDSSLKYIDLSDLNMLKVKNTNKMFEGTHLNKIILGAKNKFTKDTTLPNVGLNNWLSIGNDNEDNPEGNLSFSSTDASGKSLAKYYDGSGRIGRHTFVTKAVKATANLTIKSNLGNQVVKNVSGIVGNTIMVGVPDINGYTPDRSYVTATINYDKTITTNDEVKYTPIKSPQNPGTPQPQTPNKPSNPSNNGSINSSKPQLIKKSSFFTTFSDKGTVKLYSIDGNKVTKLSRLLGANTSWFSDQQVTINEVTYLRVATNEWVKASDGYNYQSILDVVTTKGQSKLVNARGERIVNRGLQGDAEWLTDMIVNINGDKYYRVATNEFISANDIY